MNIEKAIEVIKAKGRRVDYIPRPQPPTATLWNVPPDCAISEAVYFAYSAGRIKIGHSMLPAGRLLELQPASPHPITMILLVPGSVADERRFHDRFDSDRSHHEWFRISKKMRDFLKARLCPIGRASFKKAEQDFAAEYTEIQPAA